MLESAFEQSAVKLLSPSLIYTNYSVHISGSLYCSTVFLDFPSLHNINFTWTEHERKGII